VYSDVSFLTFLKRVLDQFGLFELYEKNAIRGEEKTMDES
jgi:hypothetical protein